jgi:hypothetical protein
MQLSTPSFLASLSAFIGLAACSADANHVELDLVSAQSAMADFPGVIEKVTFEGDGCPEGTASAGISEDGQMMTASFSAFRAEVGPDVPDPAIARGCVTRVQVNVPQGWSYTLDSADQRGYVLLDENAGAVRKAGYLISGTSEARILSEWFGPVDQPYNFRDISEQDPLPWSPCGGGQELLVRTRLTVDVGDQPERSADINLTNIDVVLRWRFCL